MEASDGDDVEPGAGAGAEAEPGSGESLAVVAEQLGAALDRAEAVPLGCHRPGEVLAWACELQRLRARVEALACRAAVATGSLDVPALEGQRTVANVVTAHTGGDPRPITADTRLGVWLGEFSAFEAAFAAGGLSRRHVEVVRGVDNSRSHGHLIDAQDDLITAAATCTWPEFVQVVRYFALASDPDGVEPNEQVQARFCRVTKRADGTVTGRFQLDPIAGHAVLTAIGRREQRLFRADTEAAESGSGPGRSSSQRRADALVELVTGGPGPGDGGGPLVQVVLSQQVVDKLLTAEQTPGRLPTGADDIDGRCELIDGTPIHPRTGIGLLAVSQFRRLVVDQAGVPIDLGRTVRIFPPALKQALLALARGRCQIPGCDAPIGWLQADHVIPWSHHGPTALHNGQILCDPHNKSKRDHPLPGPEVEP